MNTKLIAASLIALAAAAAPAFAADETASQDGQVLSTMKVEAADHYTYKFDFVAGQGWQFAGRTAVPSKIKLALEGKVTSAIAAAVQPGTTFVDAATGYKFAWTQKAGWKFVGLASRS